MDSDKVSAGSTFAGIMQILFALAVVTGVVYLGAAYVHILYRAAEIGWSLI